MPHLSRVRTLKRKTKKWGFVKNLPSKDMDMMVRSQQWRWERQGRRSKFLRDSGGGHYELVPPAKLDKYRKRRRVPCASSVSGSPGLSPNLPRDLTRHELITSTREGLPPHIMAYTPTGGTPTGSAGSQRSKLGVHPTPRSGRRVARPPLAVTDGNILTRQVGGGMKTEHHSDDYLEDYTHTPPLAQQQLGPAADPGELTSTCSPLCTVARDTGFHGLYREAADKYRFLADRLDTLWHRTVHQFNAEVMDAALYAGCPLTLVFRIADILSRSSARLRARNNDNEHDNRDLHYILALLENTARYWTNVLVHRRALEMWEPVLGPEHPISALLVRNLALMHTNRDATTIVDFLRGTEGAEISVLGTPPPMLAQPPPPLWTAVRDLPHLSDTGPLAQHIANPAIPGHHPHHIAHLQLGRERALDALHHHHHPGSPNHFMQTHDTESSIDEDPCPEIKLHRILWLAEHRHRMGDHAGALALVHKQYSMLFMGGMTDPSEFIVNHFPARFEALLWTMLGTAAGDEGGGSLDDCPPSNQEEFEVWNGEVWDGEASSAVMQPGEFNAGYWDGEGWD